MDAEDAPPLPAVGAVLIPAGLLSIGGGVTLFVWGYQEHWVRGEMTAAPVVRVGPTSASARWAF